MIQFAPPQVNLRDTNGLAGAPVVLFLSNPVEDNPVEVAANLWKTLRRSLGPLLRGRRAEFLPGELVSLEAYTCLSSVVESAGESSDARSGRCADRQSLLSVCIAAPPVNDELPNRVQHTLITRNVPRGFRGSFSGNGTPHMLKPVPRRRTLTAEHPRRKLSQRKLEKRGGKKGEDRHGQVTTLLPMDLRRNHRRLDATR